MVNGSKGKGRGWMDGWMHGRMGASRVEVNAKKGSC